MPDLHTKGRALPSYLARIQAHNDAHLRWLLVGRMVKALLAGHTAAGFVP